MLIGLTGSMGSGKSTVARMLRECGASIVDADQIAHQLISQAGPVRDEVLKQFGEGYLGQDGQLDRAKLAREIFADEKKRKKLESIIHPAVKLEMIRQIQVLNEAASHSQARNHRPKGLVVLDVPLLFESGMESLVDQVLVVTITDSKRRQRLKLRDDSLEPAEISRRLAAQWPQDRKASLANEIVDNSGDLQETRKQVNQLVSQWEKAENEF